MDAAMLSRIHFLYLTYPILQIRVFSPTELPFGLFDIKDVKPALCKRGCMQRMLHPAAFH